MDKLVKKIDFPDGTCTYDFSAEYVGEFLRDHEKGVNALFKRVYELENAPRMETLKDKINEYITELDLEITRCNDLVASYSEDMWSEIEILARVKTLSGVKKDLQVKLGEREETIREARLIVTGNRDFDDYKLLSESIDKVINKIIEDISVEHIDRIAIISGTARGADSLGEVYAKKNGLPCYRFPVKWDELGKRAGYVRNEEMAKFAITDGNMGILIAFWDGVSKVTKHMIDLANKHGVKVYVVNFKTNEYDHEQERV